MTGTKLRNNMIYSMNNAKVLYNDLQNYFQRVDGVCSAFQIAKKNNNKKKLKTHYRHSDAAFRSVSLSLWQHNDSHTPKHNKNKSDLLFESVHKPVAMKAKNKQLGDD